MGTSGITKNPKASPYLSEKKDPFRSVSQYNQGKKRGLRCGGRHSFLKVSLGTPAVLH